MGNNPSCNNPVVVELEEKDVSAEYKYTVKNEEHGSIAVGFHSYEDVDSKAHDKNAKTPPPKKDKVPDEEIGANGGAEKSEDNDEVAELRYEPKADSHPGQQSERDEKSSNADMLYAVVDKSRKKKK